MGDLEKDDKLRELSCESLPDGLIKHQTIMVTAIAASGPDIISRI